MTTENNKIITEFLKAPYYKQYEEYKLYGILDIIKDGKSQQHFFKLEDMLFNSDWDWLMELVDKIESIKDKEEYILYDVVIFSDAVLVEDREGKEIVLINKSKGNFTNKIEAVYNACLAFIEWYNKNAVKELKTERK